MIKPTLWIILLLAFLTTGVSLAVTQSGNTESIEDSINNALKGVDSGKYTSKEAFDTGLLFLSKGKNKLAHQVIEGLAERGYADAQVLLGSGYDKGNFTNKDPKKALYWFNKAAAQGNTHAQRRLGVMYHQGSSIPKDLPKAEHWYKLAAQKGDSAAQFFLGALYYSGGKDIPKNQNKALNWFKESALQGEADAQALLGKMYYNGEGTTADASSAYKWYAKAAAQGNANAQLWTGGLLLRGLGVKMNVISAYQWLYVAAKNGNKMAADTIKKTYKDVSPTRLSSLKKLGEALYKTTLKK